MRSLFIPLLCLLLLSGCRSAYYETMEKFGIEKRDILVDRVEEARDAQEDSKAVFTSALEQFSLLTDFEGGDLEKLYDSMKRKLDLSEEAAKEVKDRIGSIESVGSDLFSEWESEIVEYTSPDLRRKSRDALEQTRDSYSVMIRKMRSAEASMYPVLDLFRDQVLFLKHNLNARAIASLDNETGTIEKRVRKLIAEMEASIAEADAFISSMR